MCQLTGMPGTEPPADDLAGFEVEHDRQVIPMSLKPQVGEVLYPSMSVDHVSVALAVLWAQFIFEPGIALQGVRRRGNFWRGRPTAPALLGVRWYDDACKRADTPGFLFVPAKAESQAVNAVEWMQLVGCTQSCDGLLVGFCLFRWSDVVACASEAQELAVLLAPPWVDLVQGS